MCGESGIRCYEYIRLIVSITIKKTLISDLITATQCAKMCGVFREFPQSGINKVYLILSYSNLSYLIFLMQLDIFSAGATYK